MLNRVLLCPHRKDCLENGCTGCCEQDPPLCRDGSNVTHRERPVSAAVSPAEPPEGETLDALRWSLLKAMGDWSEGMYAAGWMSGTEEMLHEQGGIWEILGRAVGWPTGYEYGPDFRWVSWDEAGAIFADRKAARGR